MNRGFAPVMAILVITILGVVGYFGYKYFKSTNQESKQSAISPTPSISFQTARQSVDTSSWSEFVINSLNLSFKLPARLSQWPDNLKEEIIPGESGSMICLSCESGTFGLGTTSTDYAEGRGGTFMDLQGFEVSEDKYFAKFVSGKRWEIPKDLLISVESPFDIDMIRVVGRNYTYGEYRGPIEGTPGEGWVGALINVPNNQTFTGLAVKMKLSGDLDINLFDQILSTFKFAR